MCQPIINVHVSPPTHTNHAVVQSPATKRHQSRSQALSSDLLSVTLEIPFSVPPYMSLLARSIATLEGIALIGDPQYQMGTWAHCKLLTDAASLLPVLPVDEHCGSVICCAA